LIETVSAAFLNSIEQPLIGVSQNCRGLKMLNTLGTRGFWAACFVS
jgi:hypothetical protein